MMEAMYQMIGAILAGVVLLGLLSVALLFATVVIEMWETDKDLDAQRKSLDRQWDALKREHRRREKRHG